MGQGKGQGFDLFVNWRYCRCCKCRVWNRKCHFRILRPQFIIALRIAVPRYRLLFISCFFSLPCWTSGTLLAAGHDAASTTVAGPLDGLSFRGAVGPDGKPKDIPGLFVFENGNFVSRECELRCQYPARPYCARHNGDKTEFSSETKCPYKDATMVWRGTIEGDKLTGKSTWVDKRWYWTVENTFKFEGSLQTESPATASPD